MTEQLRPVDGRQEHRAAVEAGYASLPEYVAVEAGGCAPPILVAKHAAPEIDLLTQVSEIVRQAKIEFEGGFHTAGRLEITHAQQLLDRAFHGEAV